MRSAEKLCGAVGLILGIGLLQARRSCSGQPSPVVLWGAFEPKFPQLRLRRHQDLSRNPRKFMVWGRRPSNASRESLDELLGLDGLRPPDAERLNARPRADRGASSSLVASQ